MRTHAEAANDEDARVGGPQWRSGGRQHRLLGDQSCFQGCRIRSPRARAKGGQAISKDEGTETEDERTAQGEFERQRSRVSVKMSRRR